MSEVHYREGVPADAESILEFQVAMARETEDVTLEREVTNRGVHAVFADPSLGRYFIAESGGRAIASLMITYEWSDWRNGVVWWIQSVFVEAALRGQGVYAGLYAYVQSMVNADPAIKGIRLYVDRRNSRAQQVYARLGMNGDHYSVFEWMKAF